MADRYAIIELNDLPYPHGIGKTDYPELEHEIRRLLGKAWADPDVNREALNAPNSSYRSICAKHLAATFNRPGVTIAETVQVAADLAKDHPAVLPNATAVDTTDFREQMRVFRTPPNSTSLIEWATSFVDDPITIGGGMIIDGRHRITALRVFGAKDSTPVLVRTCSD